MIVVLGRPGLSERSTLDRLAGRIAVAAAAAPARVELVGSIGDDAEGDAVVVELGRAGIGHAAVLRDSAARTPRGDDAEAPLPRLDAADIELGLQYLSECRVLVVAEALDDAALRAAADGAAYHSAQLVIIRDPGREQSVELPAGATLLERPEEDAGAFARLVGGYAAQLEAGRAPAEAWHDALADTGWEQAPASEL